MRCSFFPDCKFADDGLQLIGHLDEGSGWGHCLLAGRKFRDTGYRNAFQRRNSRPDRHHLEYFGDDRMRSGAGAKRRGDAKHKYHHSEFRQLRSYKPSAGTGYGSSLWRWRSVSDGMVRLEATPMADLHSNCKGIAV